MLIFRLKELSQVKNGLTASLLFFCFENAKDLGRSDDAKRKKKRRWPYALTVSVIQCNCFEPSMIP